MTAMTTILGLVPMVCSSGEGSEMMKPMGVVMMTGMVISTLSLIHISQTMLITIKNLGCTKENLQVTLTQLDRNLAVLKTQRKLGMIGQLQLDTVQNQRDKLAQSIDTLETTRENLGSSVALMCGLDANTIVMPADFETLYEGCLLYTSRCV